MLGPTPNAVNASPPAISKYVALKPQTAKPSEVRGQRLCEPRAIQDWLGHRSIQHTVRYTELTPTRFRGRSLHVKRARTKGGFVFETERAAPFTSDAVNRHR